ncbi:MAG: hypothetical protein AAB418_05360 [candidate division NC10 bacterium]
MLVEQPPERGVAREQAGAPAVLFSLPSSASTVIPAAAAASASVRCAPQQ